MEIVTKILKLLEKLVWFLNGKVWKFNCSQFKNLKTKVIEKYKKSECPEELRD